MDTQQQEVCTHYSVADNYWDKLLSEIQEYIWKYKVHLEQQEVIQKARWRNLCKEIRQYGE